MLSKDLVKKRRHIEIKSNRLVDEIFSGEYRASFRVKGMEFEDIREYYHGDDVRNIDWNVTARYDQAFVKQFSEERELNIFLMIDVSHSNDFGRKKELIAEIGATISFSATRNNDQVGLLLFTDKVEKFIPSRKGKRHVLSIIDTILSFEPNRLGVAKDTIRDFVADRFGDQIGLIVFAGNAYTRIPLTLDHELLEQSIQEVDVSSVGEEGTAIGMAI